MAITYGFEVRWTTLDGGSCRFGNKGHASPEDAMRAILPEAIQSGWTPPRWWQWWRWDDTRVDLDRARAAGIEMKER